MRKERENGISVERASQRRERVCVRANTNESVDENENVQSTQDEAAACMIIYAYIQQDA